MICDYEKDCENFKTKCSICERNNNLEDYLSARIEESKKYIGTNKLCNFCTKEICSSCMVVWDGIRKGKK
jgi:hypothetical protein